MCGALSALFLTSASTLTLSVHRNLFYYFNTIPGNSSTGIKFTYDMHLYLVTYNSDDMCSENEPRLISSFAQASTRTPP